MNSRKFGTVQLAVFDNMGFILPSQDAGLLGGQGHRATLISAVLKIRFHNLGIARDKAGTQALAHWSAWTGYGKPGSV